MKLQNLIYNANQLTHLKEGGKFEGTHLLIPSSETPPFGEGKEVG